MNAERFMAQWGRHEFSDCLSDLESASPSDLITLCQEIPVSELGRLCSVFFYSRQMSNSQTSAYASLIETKFSLAKKTGGMALAQAAGACYTFSLSIPEHMECSFHRGGGSQVMRDVFKAYTASLLCLKAHAEVSGPDLIRRNMADRWVEALSYDFTMIDEVDKQSIAFINKIVTLRGDRIASTMIYSLKQQANHAPVEERAARFAEGIEKMLVMLSKCDLIFAPKDVEPLIKEIDCIAQYFHNQGIKPVLAARNALLLHMLDPDMAGRWLGNSYAKTGRKPLDLFLIKRLATTIEKALEKPESHEISQLRWTHKVGIINAMGRLTGTPSVIENAVVSLIKDCEDDQIQSILCQVTSAASVIMARGIGRRLPDRVRLVTPKLGEKIFAVDLGL